jgi:anion-transporting  ArsA/GET3 family ATPase
LPVFEQQLIVVSGKGGVGKTAIATAIAVRSARSVPTILVSLGYEPVMAMPGLSVMRVDGLSAIREYVRRNVPFSGLYDVFLTSRMFRDFAEAAPGFEEIMCLGKLYDLASESEYGRIVFDAPSTGHMKTLIDVPAATLKAVRVGPLNHNARRIQDLLLDPDRTRVVLAALPEEMAVREAMELDALCRERRLGVGPVVINQHVTVRFSEEEVRALEKLADTSPTLRLAIDCAAAELELCASQTSAMAPLIEAGAHVLSVPQCIDHEPALLIEAIVAALDEGTDGG